jgi:MYXO-CTERM domain-containing protein
MLRWIPKVLLTVPMVLLIVPSSARGQACLSDGACFSTIEQALTYASTGDVIQVHPGAYYESLSITKDVTVISIGGSEQTVIWGSSGTAVVSVGDYGSVAIQGFSIHDSSGRRGMSIGRDSLVVLRDIKMIDLVGTRQGQAIRLDRRSSVDIYDSEFANISVDGAGYDVIHMGESSVLGVEETEFTTLRSMRGAVLGLTEDSYADIRSSTWHLNDSQRSTIAGSWGTWVQVRNSTFEGNLSTEGGAILGEHDAHIDLEQTDFLRNRGYGGAIRVQGEATLRIRNATFEENESWGDGGAIFGSGEAQIDLRDSFFLGNEASSGGAIRIEAQALLESRNVTFRGNAAEEDGGAIANVGTTPLLVEYSTFEENTATTGGAISWQPAAGSAETTATIRRSEFVGNTATSGGAIWTKDAGAWQLEDNVFRGNGATIGGGALLADEVASVHGWNNWFCLNDGGQGGGAVDLGTLAEAGVWTHNFFLDNSVDPDAGLGGALRTAGPVHVSFNTFLGNRAGEGAAVHAGGSLLLRNNAIAWSEGASTVHVAEEEGDYGYNLFHENDGMLPSPISAPPENVYQPPGFYDYAPGIGCDADLRVRWGEGGVVHAGDPELENPDGSPADIGAWGGPLGPPSAWVDQDGDGWPWVYDCDDEDPSIHPGAIEVCDGRDTSCSGAVDDVGPESDATWYRDADGDGFGDPDDRIYACSQPDGYVDNDLDCDDSDPEVHPDAIEVCDGRDTSCTGTVDADADGPLGCECAIGEIRDCYDGPESTEDVGVCVGGSQTCIDGTWGPCEGQVLPAPEDDCDTPLDENCDGVVNDGCDDPKGEDPNGEDPNGEDPNGEDPNGEDPNGEDPNGEDPNGEDPNGDVVGCSCASSRGEGLLALVLVGLVGLHLRRHHRRRPAAHRGAEGAIGS